MPPLIEARGLRRSFGDTLAVDDVGLVVAAGEVYGLVGPDGAGKTTTMRLLCGALAAQAGSVWIDGHDLSRQTELARAQIGYLPQRFSLYGELTVLENLHFFAKVRGLPDAEWLPRSNEILEFVGLAEFADRRAEKLSGGMKQKLGLAVALVHRPRVLLLDEPTGGVDPVTRQSFWQLLIRLLNAGAAVLISTPYMDEASRCSRVGFMHHGRILIEGAPNEIAARMHGRVIEIVAEPRRVVERAARGLPQVEDVQAFGDRFHVHVEPGSGAAVMERLESGIRAAGGSVTRVRMVPPGLEDVFIEMLRSEGRPAGAGTPRLEAG